jgi:3-hydroxyisobutyrate dehydrogenase
MSLFLSPEAMGKSIIYQGQAGSGQHTKMCNQIMVAGTMVGMCESLLYGYNAGLNLDAMLKSISGGAAACWSLNNLAPRILKQDFQPGFMVEHFIKDLGIALEEARRMSLQLPGLKLAEQLYAAVSEQGHDKLGTQALVLGLAEISGISFQTIQINRGVNE